MSYFKQNYRMLIGCALGALAYGPLGAAIGGFIGAMTDRSRAMYISPSGPRLAAATRPILKKNPVIVPAWKSLRVAWAAMFLYAFFLLAEGMSGDGILVRWTAALKAVGNFIVPRGSQFSATGYGFDHENPLLRSWINSSHGIVDFLAGVVPALRVGHDRLAMAGYDADHSPLLNLIAAGWVLTLAFLFAMGISMWRLSGRYFRDGSWSERLAPHSNQQGTALLLAGVIFTALGIAVCFFGIALGRNFGALVMVDDVGGILVAAFDFMILALGLYALLGGGLIVAAKLQRNSRIHPSRSG